jgi:hypothetical protein
VGAESIVLANQYEDDEFGEDEIRYAGNGSRDPKTGHQVADQVATGTNLALLKSQETGRPVRVLRKVLHHDGREVYRYEGLYRVTAAAYQTGKSGFQIYLFTLQPAPPGSLITP